MSCDSGEDDCILISKLSDECGVEEKAAEVILVPDSSDNTGEQASSAAQSESEIVCDNTVVEDQSQVPLQQNLTNPVIESQGVENSSSPQCFPNTSKYCSYYVYKYAYKYLILILFYYKGKERKRTCIALIVSISYRNVP